MNDDVANTYIQSGTITGGIGNLTITTQRKFSGSTGSVNVEINGNNVGTVPYGTNATTTSITGINVLGGFNIKILNNIGGSNSGGADRVAIDDINWTGYTVGGGNPSVSLSADLTSGSEDATTGNLNCNRFRSSNRVTVCSSWVFLVRVLLELISLLSSTTLQIPDGATTGSVTFTIADDAQIEGTETATLTISSPTSGITLGSPSSVDIDIIDNDNCTSSTTSLPYNGINGSAEFNHSSSSPPAAGSQEACGSNFRLTYSSAPGTDSGGNFFGTDTQPSNGLASTDFGGEASFQTFLIDVSAVTSVDIECFGITQGGSVFNGATEQFEWWYTLDGGAQQVFFSPRLTII